MALQMIAQRCEAGNAWLADCHARPAAVHQAWNTEVLAPIPSGGRWLAAEARLVTVLRALYRIREEQRGPVLADPEHDRAWVLVPLAAAEDLADLGRVTVQPAGWMLRCPPAGWALEGRFWLWRPDGTGHLTDPAVLAAALGPGGYRRSEAS
jgi:hypothetical protein